MNIIENKQIMAKNIRMYMEIKGITNQQICDALGFKYTTFMDWIKGSTYPRIEKIEAMANYFGCKKSDLIENHTNENSLKIGDLHLRIKKLIEESGLSYLELEKKTGVPKSSLQRYASGATSKIPLPVIEKLATAFGVDPNFIMGWEDAGLTERLRADPYFFSAVEKLDKLDREKLAAVDQLLSAIL